MRCQQGMGSQHVNYWECLLEVVMASRRRLGGNGVFFSTGGDKFPAFGSSLQAIEERWYPDGYRAVSFSLPVSRSTDGKIRCALGLRVCYVLRLA